jgi:hypothetical protein
MAERKSEPNVKTKVAEWLSHEGYPLEYVAASEFFGAGFGVHQGIYVKTSEDEPPREIDIVATADADHSSQPHVRLEYVVECKWSRDKPWVVFTSPFSRMASSACISQTIGSELGHAALWLDAGNRNLTSMSTFRTPKIAGFGGRQALSQSRDVFFNAVQSVVSAALATAKAYDEHPVLGIKLPEFAVVVFPVIVIDGDLFEAFPKDSDASLQLRQVRQSRLHWSGASTYDFHVTLDIVTVAALRQFVVRRAREAQRLIPVISDAVRRIQSYAATAESTDLKITRGPRGMVGFPPLIARLRKAHREANAARQKKLQE